MQHLYFDIRSGFALYNFNEYVPTLLRRALSPLPSPLICNFSPFDRHHQIECIWQNGRERERARDAKIASAKLFVGACSMFVCCVFVYAIMHASDGVKLHLVQMKSESNWDMSFYTTTANADDEQ